MDTYKAYEDNVKQAKQADASHDDQLRFEILYADEFVAAFDQFATTQISMEDFKALVKNQIDKKVRDIMAGKVEPKADGRPGARADARAEPKIPVPVPVVAPVPKPSTSGGAGSGPKISRPDPSNDHRGEMGSSRPQRDDHSAGPRFGGDRGGPTRDHPRDIGREMGGPKPDSQEIKQLETKLAHTERELRLAREALDDADKKTYTLNSTIRELRQDNDRLQRLVETEKARADQAARNSSLATGASEATRVLKEKVKDLEAEIDLMNKQNAKLLDALKAANSAQNGLSASFGVTRAEDELMQRIQNLTRKLEAAEAQNRHLREANNRDYDGNRPNVGGSESLNDKVIRLESENQVLRRGICR